MPDINVTCTFHKTQNPQCPIFRLGDIFQETGDNFSDVAIQVGDVFVQWDVGGWVKGWRMTNGQEAGPLGLNNMLIFIEHFVNPCMVTGTFPVSPYLIPQQLYERHSVYSFPVPATTNYHKFCGLKQHPFTRSQFCKSEVRQSTGGFSAESLIRLKSSCWLSFISFKILILFQAHSNCWPNLVPFGSRIETSIHFLVGSWGPLSAPGDCPYSLSRHPSIFKVSNRASSLCRISLTI